MKQGKQRISADGAGIRLVVADDHALFCAGVERLFRESPRIETVATATRFRQALRLVQRLSPQVVIVHPRLSDAGTFETARRFRDHGPSTALMFLDDLVRELHVRAAVQGRAQGYWTKHASFGAILRAVCELASGGNSFCPAAWPFIAETQNGLQFMPSARSSALARLTRRETEVFLHLAEGSSVKQCAVRLSLSPCTVDNHKTRLMKKLDVHKVVDLARLAARENLFD
jgi:DNA-binding NarL/FixJ family response regulator